MIPTLNERFAATSGQPILEAGREIRIVYDTNLPLDADEMNLHIEHFDLGENKSLLRLEAKCQGVKVHMQDGDLAQRFVAWDSSRPADVTIPLVNRASGDASVRLWVSWITTAGMENAWVHNTGVVISSIDKGVRLNWNIGGLEPPTFDDLVLRAWFTVRGED